MNRYKIALDKKEGKYKPNSKDMVKPQETAPLPAPKIRDLVYPLTFQHEGDVVVSQGPRSRLFNLRGPNGYSVSIPLRNLDIRGEGELLTIRLTSAQVRAFLNDVEVIMMQQPGYIRSTQSRNV